MLVDIPDISDLIGAPFSNHGRDPKESLSCWGVVMEVQRRFGNIVPDYAISAQASTQIAVAYECSKNNWITIPEPETGCVIAMAIDSRYPNYIQHFGVCLGKTFIHTLEKMNCIQSPMNHKFFAGKMKGFHIWKNEF